MPFADMTVSFALVRETFTSRDALDRASRTIGALGVPMGAMFDGAFRTFAEAGSVYGRA